MEHNSSLKELNVQRHMSSYKSMNLKEFFSTFDWHKSEFDVYININFMCKY